MFTTNFAQSFVGLLAAVVGCQAIEPPDPPSHTAFTNAEPLEIREDEPIGRTVALRLTRPRFTGTELAEMAHVLAQVVADAPLPGVDSIPAEQLQSFETAAAAVEGRVWFVLETGEEKLEFDYYPQHPSIIVGLIDRQRPHFTEAGTHPGIGRDAALARARRCADSLAEQGVISPGSYARNPVLERAPTSSYPADADTAGTVEVTDHYHFIFGQVLNGILLGNTELTIDVDAHSGDCFRLGVALIDHRAEGPVDLIVPVREARAVVENDVPATGGRKVVGEGRVVYWLDPHVPSAIVEPRYVSSYTIVSKDGLASHGTSFAVSLSQQPPVVTEF